MILYGVSLAVFLFVAINLFFRARCPLWLKIFGSAILLLISLKYAIYQIVGGAFFAPQLPEAFLIAFEALYGAELILFFLLLLMDFYLAGNWLLSRAGVPVPRRVPLGLIKSGLAGIALCLGIWGAWQAVKIPEVRSVAIYLPNLPEELDGFKIAQISDVHIGPIFKKDWLGQIVSRVNALDPDIIALTGDYVDGYADRIGNELEPLASLKAKYGVFGVAGNHEYYWNMPEWKRALENFNVVMLENENRKLDINGKTLVIAGIPDLVAERFGLDAPDPDKALSGALSAPVILLSHQAKKTPDYRQKIDLILSGHTHGGLMFFLEPLVARFNGGFVKGAYTVNGNNLYVSSGAGLWNGFSCRIGAPAEIAQIILKRKKSQSEEDSAIGADAPAR